MSIFDDVKQAADIKRVIEFYGCKVDRAGKFICPFHKDTHPSGSIKHDYFNCFVCGAGGDAISFVGRMFGLSNIDAAKKIIADMRLPIVVDRPLTAAERLKADRERAKRRQQQKEREQMDALVARTGSILADYHAYLWQGIQLCPCDDKRHIRGLQEITQAEYYLSCYDDDPQKYSLEARGLVAKIERKLYSWHHERQ